jgi:predicted oxidoreductase
LTNKNTKKERNMKIFNFSNNHFIKSVNSLLLLNYSL